MKQQMAKTPTTTSRRKALGRHTPPPGRAVPESLRSELRGILTGQAVQPKLTASRPGDRYEREADEVADKVLGGQWVGTISRLPAAGLARQALRQDVTEDEEEVQTQPLQRQDVPEEEELQTKPLMMKADNGRSIASPSLTQQLNSTKGGGTSLSNRTGSLMSQAFSHDFSKVRVHTDKNAIQMNEGLNARAFTHGSEIYFNQGQYNPDSTVGIMLLAHELAHVLQQNRTTDSIQKNSANISSQRKRIHQWFNQYPGNPESSSAFSKLLSNNEYLKIIRSDPETVEWMRKKIKRHSVPEFRSYFMALLSYGPVAGWPEPFRKIGTEKGTVFSYIRNIYRKIIEESQIKKPLPKFVDPDLKKMIESIDIKGWLWPLDTIPKYKRVVDFVRKILEGGDRKYVELLIKHGLETWWPPDVVKKAAVDPEMQPTLYTKGFHFNPMYRLLKGKKAKKSYINLNVTDIRQGHVGDCYFLATLAGLVKLRPDIIKKMMKIHDNGVITVTFFRILSESGNYELGSPLAKINVLPGFPMKPSEQQKLAYAGTSKEDKRIEYWVAILEKAYGMWRGRYLQGAKQRGVNRESEGFKRVHGGQPAVTMYDFGMNITMEKNARLIKRYSSSQQLGKVINKYINERRIVVADSHTTVKNLSLWAKHAYMIDRIDGETITLYDPHGLRSKYEKVRRSKGYISISLKQFMTYFFSLTISTPLAMSETQKKKQKKVLKKMREILFLD